MQEKDVGIVKGDINMEEKIVTVLNEMSDKSAAEDLIDGSLKGEVGI